MFTPRRAAKSGERREKHRIDATSVLVLGCGMANPSPFSRNALRYLMLTWLVALSPLLACSNSDSGVCTDQSCVCGEGDCAQECDDGSCEQNCTGADSCRQDCLGGNCNMFCATTEACVVSCPGGDCDLNCTSASECRITDCASGCDLACNGAATCENSCDVAAGCGTSP